ncbi:hypothetical protein RFI_29664 [Reticulomyxa filosa]|uniref:Uncharacterized protein n=1 Tax=Reticulomyxa filosa TaxID=46433 RepID=X6M3X1_RETFI|nr:hypothetical protein RFI_29664 [Reticulomyxa filosa]|eukprot:ETO07725.1 hypothetical protein RFI_29664 [Reticulomyxa filosa]
MVLTNFNGERAAISGGIEIDCKWELYQQKSNNINIYQCKVPDTVNNILGLRVNGQRAIRARYPNANPETQGFGSKLEAKAWFSPPFPYLPEFECNPEFPQRNTSTFGYYSYYNLGSCITYLKNKKKLTTNQKIQKLINDNCNTIDTQYKK